MPEGEALAGLPEADASALEKYAGSALDTGPEAQAYADHYILAHMNAASDGRTYQQVSGEFLALDDAAKASEEGQALGGLRQTLFMGNTLRGLLLYGYAFATVGTIAGYAALAMFAGGLVLLALVQLGHAARPPHREGGSRGHAGAGPGLTHPTGRGGGHARGAASTVSGHDRRAPARPVWTRHSAA